ncbi:MAG: ATPase [Firmicutes bacterium]|nr:ATPase [Bacillota bacterium]
MKPVYIDIHIHTSDDANNLNNDYDIDLLLEKIAELSKGAETLLSLTDHNTINKDAYLKLCRKTENVLLGAELHIRNYEDKPPYHCHIIFKTQVINQEIIDDLNLKLDTLYPDKRITPETHNVPTLERIINEFSNYEFVLLPHGGQSHSTFEKSVPREVRFDSTIERSIYYNQFDGFTARDNRGLDQTQEYFKRLGIFGFVNLVTCTDNYNPNIYPNAKASGAGPFIPTWMFARPTFDGLRLSLSESDRFVYSHDMPNIEHEHIKKVFIKNDKLDIDVTLTTGLNVVIGSSSSGKTLLIDSVYRKSVNDFETSRYKYLGVEGISISNPSGIIPYYIPQNYIINVIDQTNDQVGIENIDLIKQVFPEDSDVVQQVRDALALLKTDIFGLIDKVKIIEEEKKKINRIPILSRLIVESKIEKNLASQLLPNDALLSLYTKDDKYYEGVYDVLNQLKNFMNDNPFASSVDEEIDSIIAKIKDMKEKIDFEYKARTVIDAQKQDIDAYLASINSENQRRSLDFEKLLVSINKYVKSKKDFNKILDKISNYSFSVNSREIISMGHKLHIQNSFQLSKDFFLKAINKFLKNANEIENFENIVPEALFSDKYSGRSPRVAGYGDMQNKLYSEFEKLNKRQYKIITREGRSFDELSAGWKTSVLLDLILGYERDIAPLIIDQPEDNLATDYINRGLIESVKNIKNKKQIILVSHNATIPMLGDAQNVILCSNKDGKIIIRSAELEGCIDEISVVDHIAKITDGGKSAIKKRVKKYNLKNFRGEN